MESIGKIANQMVPPEKQEYFSKLLKDSIERHSTMTPEEKRQHQKEQTLRLVNEENLRCGELDKLDGYNCPICKNRGYIAKAREYAGIWQKYAVECRCKKIRHTVRLMKSSGLEDLIKGHKLEDYKAEEDWQKEILRKAKDFAKNPCGWFYIGGQPGSGKTHICTGIARELLLKNVPTFYMLWRDWVSKIKSSWGSSERETADYTRLKSIRCLYIDDFLKTPRSGELSAWELETAFELINSRYNQKDSITIISSEKSIMDLVRLDEATASRIAEKSKYILGVKSDPQKNYRLKKIREMES